MAGGDGLRILVNTYHSGLGIAGDSLTFLGALVLAAEALWKKSERMSVAARETIVEFFPDAEDREGNRISPVAVEERWRRKWERAAKAGAVLLAIGFGLLLVCRIFAD